MHASLPEGGRWPDPTSLHDGPRGVVARILDPATGRPLVVKRLEVADGDVACVAVRLMGVAMVDHPGVGVLRGVRPVDGAVEVVRDDLPEDASVWLERPPSWDDLRSRTLEILDALAAIHGEGSTHGALRPTNVRWDGDGPLRLVDGGWPQAGRPEGHRGTSGDLWDVGALLWAACTGTRPSPGEPLPAFVPRQPVPDALGTLLANLLHADPLWRYDLAADAATDVRALGEPVDAREGVPSPGPISAGPASTGPIPWLRPTPSSLPDTCPVSESQGWRLHQPPLVGRSQELDTLWRAARDAASGPVVVLLVGARGMGRTRLARRFVRELARGGWADPVWLAHDGDALHDGVLGSLERAYAERPTEAAEATAYLARRLARGRGVILEDVAEEAAALRRILGPHAPDEPQRMDPARKELTRRLRADAWRGRGVVVVDDAHRSGDPWEGLQLAASLQQSDLAVLVVATLDLDALDDEGVAQRVAALADRGARKVLLRPITSEHLDTILDGAHEVATAEARSRIAATTEGCPEVARQLILALFELGERDGAGAFGWPVGVGPEGDWLGPRIAHAAEHSGHPKRFLDAVHLASLAEGGLPASVAHTFLGPVVVQAAASGLWSRHHLGERDGTGSWVLSALVHEATRRRAEARADVAYLHRRLAEAHGRRSEGRAQAVAARHGLQAGDRERAVPRLLTAVQRAWAAGRHDGLDLALGAARSGGPPELWLWAVRAALQDAERLAEALEVVRALDGEDRLLAELVLLHGHHHLDAGRIEEADAAFTEAAERASRARAPEVEARAIAGKGAVAHQQRNFSGAEVHYTRAVHRMAVADAPRSMAQVMMDQGFVARRMGRFREAAELYDEASDGFREADDLVGAARARLGLARVRRQQLELDAARSWVDVAARAADDLLDAALQRDVLLVSGDVSRQAGDAAAAEAAYRAYLAFPGSEDPEGRVVAGLGLAQVALSRGDVREAYERANDAAAALEKLPNHWLWAPYRLVVAAQLADRKDHMQTWQWLWSASELGLGDTVDRDTAALLTRVCNVAKVEGWGNVIRVAAKLAIDQLERLGEPEEARRVKTDITGIIRK